MFQTVCFLQNNVKSFFKPLNLNYPLYINIIIVLVIRRFLTSFGMTEYGMIIRGRSGDSHENS